ncbi:hypothetical protein BY996DRAFT_6417746 [Phakopsora pachyrhizi]|nr:hypothetical protein BY996DRAFT_6417746 [Phakopsora pachyrhizi]
MYWTEIKHLVQVKDSHCPRSTRAARRQPDSINNSVSTLPSSPSGSRSRSSSSRKFVKVSNKGYRHHQLRRTSTSLNEIFNMNNSQPPFQRNNDPFGSFNTRVGGFGKMTRSGKQVGRNRRLTELERQELESNKKLVLERLEEETSLIKDSKHPILLEFEKNFEIGKMIRLDQLEKRFNRLIESLEILNVDRQDRVWKSWNESRVRMRSEMILKCQIELSRAPFEFLISTDTTNLQAIFHLTEPPKQSIPKFISSSNAVKILDLNEPLDKSYHQSKDHNSKTTKTISSGGTDRMTRAKSKRLKMVEQESVKICNNKFEIERLMIEDLRKKRLNQSFKPVDDDDDDDQNGSIKVSKTRINDQTDTKALFNLDQTSDLNHRFIRRSFTPFDWNLNDKEIKDDLTFLRNHIR